MRVTLLGCGGSAGVPQIGGTDGRGAWGVCDPADPRNRRSRTSAVVEDAAGRRLLIDAGPDLRNQFLSCGIATIDAVAFTHAHADHVLGIDDLRSVNRLTGTALDAFGSYSTLSQLGQRFDYAFRAPTPPGFYRPALTARAIAPGETVTMAGMSVQVFRQDHRVMETLGFRIGRFGYSTDVVTLPEESLAELEGLDTWVVGCFQRRPHPVHADVAQVLDWVARLKPRRTVLTHMGTDMDFGELHRMLPAGVEPAHDGMVLEIPEG
ncbi:MBL fold metallo-hydrolase [Roseomonas frigidaquae]|uniref:MBL fold metallo-hydrolase n=1 Tax=Falsiroseomonas frigidaquae TaxID=487318 RepID=A0ABX1F478_9PROT|nr:MBL fold metallo-hydrolase [Falsiroseomonas frigidaquae]